MTQLLVNQVLCTNHLQMLHYLPRLVTVVYTQGSKHYAVQILNTFYLLYFLSIFYNNDRCVFIYIYLCIFIYICALSRTEEIR